MKKLVRCGLLLLALSLIGLTFLTIGTQTVFATEEEAEPELESQEEYPQDKADAIEAANDAIGDIVDPDFIIAYEEQFVQDTARALSLVEKAREEYGAVDSDFEDLNLLHRAEQKVLMFLAIQEFKDTVDKIPPLDEITEEDRGIIEEARRLAVVAMEDYGATPFSLCWRYYYLEDAEDRLDDVEEEPEPEPEPEPEEPDDRQPTPPTGGLTGTVVIGALLSGAGFLFIRRRKARK